MARQEHPRENLLRDATALTPRILLWLPRPWPVEDAPVVDAPVEDAPVEDAPVEDVHDGRLPQRRSTVPTALNPDEMGDFYEVFAGWRGEALSLYFDQDPVYHFDSAGSLRRSYADGQLIKAAWGRLVRLVRDRTSGHLELVSREMSPAEQAAFTCNMGQWLERLAVALNNDQWALGGQAPPTGDAVQRLAAWLRAHPTPTIANRPHVA